MYAKYPSLLAEMYAYSMAAAHVELPHFTLHNLMVSNVHAGDEGWQWVDVLGDDVCRPPENGVFYPGNFCALNGLFRSTAILRRRDVTPSLWTI